MREERSVKLFVKELFQNYDYLNRKFRERGEGRGE